MIKDIIDTLEKRVEFLRSDLCDPGNHCSDEYYFRLAEAQLILNMVKEHEHKEKDKLNYAYDY